ncbi:MAG: ABC transporter substrate binding protein [Acidobacteriota bacterium]
MARSILVQMFIILISCCLVSCNNNKEIASPTTAALPVPPPETKTHLDTSVKPKPGKLRKIFIVSSYHPEYLWSQDTNEGVCGALLKYGYFDNVAQAEEFTRNYYIKTTHAEIKKVWMDTKRKSSTTDIAAATKRITTEINNFKPDILLLGDDNAAKYIGNIYLDTDLPVVFWGINGAPLNYGLLDSLEKPGHNITGIYQAGYMLENLVQLKKLIPSIKTFAILSDDSETGRAKAKEIKNLAEAKKLPLTLVDTVITNSFSEWKTRALELQKRVDAFFVLNHNTIKDDNGQPVDQLEIGSWYLKNIKKPECAHEKQFGVEGMLSVIDDSGYKQGYEAVKMLYTILEEGRRPAELPTTAPEQGPFIVNRERAKMLGLVLTNDMGIEEYIDNALALKRFPNPR